MSELIIFTHIPKTSGTSFKKTIIEPNIKNVNILKNKGIKDFKNQIDNNHRFASSHIPYGLHLFTNREVKYITFLRDPIERAISYYYFIQDQDPTYYIHPERIYSENLTIAEFYQLKKFQNWQTRFLAGFMEHKLYNLYKSLSCEKFILKKAIYNLIKN